MICPPFYNIFLTILNNLMIDGSMSGKKRNICNEFYTLCHIRFQVLVIIGDKSILMFVEISMRFQFLQFVMSLKKHHSGFSLRNQGGQCFLIVWSWTSHRTQ